jgi:hypothetical protein
MMGSPIRRLLSRGYTFPLHNFLALFLLLRTVLLTRGAPTPTHPGFAPCGVAQLPGSAPVTHRDQGHGRVCPLADPVPAPGNVVAPENRRCHTASKEGDHRSHGSRMGPTPGWLTAWAYPLSHLTMQGCWRAGTAANQVWGLSTNPLSSSLSQPIASHPKALAVSKGT